jgi:hypothetical protein
MNSVKQKSRDFPKIVVHEFHLRTFIASDDPAVPADAHGLLGEANKASLSLFKLFIKLFIINI